MKINAVFFDLDGTLLPLNQDVFVKAYLGGLVNFLSPMGYEPKAVAAALLKSTDDVIKNDGSLINKEVFWNSFSELLGEAVRGEEENLTRFYEGDFQNIKSVCGYSPMAKEIVDSLHQRGVRVVLATNPVFPAIATESRIRWAGLSPSDFELYTTYENSSMAKPNLGYYKEILNKLNLDPSECLMVGNDVDEDMVAGGLGMQLFLLTDNLLNRSGEDITKYNRGSFEDLKNFIDEVVK